MSENTAYVVLTLAIISAFVALIVTGHGGWVVAALLIFFVFIGS